MARRKDASRAYRNLAIWVLEQVPGIPHWFVEKTFGISRNGRLYIVKAIDALEYQDRQDLISGKTSPPVIYVGGTEDLEALKNRGA